MRRLHITLVCTFLASACWAQVRVSKLEIKRNEEFVLTQSDILVADTLIMEDSSRIVLNRLKPENYIRATVAIIGKNCIIDGRGIDGKPGRNGRNGDTPIGPCKDGGNGRNGSKGLDGGPGNDLFLYFSSMEIKGRLFVNLTGGNGGQGGNGGLGGGGSPGTVHCNGGDGGDGGDGATGGNGGPGGTLNIDCTKCPNVRAMMGRQIVLMNAGGNFGFGGIAGYGGPAGLGPSRRDGKAGARGADADNGRSGERGKINFDLD